MNIRRANEIDFGNRLRADRSIDPRYAPLNVSRIDNLYIVNDTYLFGGTKSRVCYDFLLEQVNKGFKEFVYVSPWNGAACIALTVNLNMISHDLKSTVFIENINESPPFIRIGEENGAKIVKCPKDKLVDELTKYLYETPNCFFINPGFNYIEIENKISSLAKNIKDEYGIFDEVWCAVGSGTLIKGLQKSRLGIKYFGVCIFGRIPKGMTAEAIIHNQKDTMPTEEDFLPPYQSAMFYDSKIYQYVKGRKGKILIWNVI